MEVNCVVENESIELVTKELSTGTPLYAFKPNDVEEKFFIGEAIIAAAAAVFVTAFLKGVNEALEKRGEELGKTITTWVVDKISGLFRKPKEAKSLEDEFKKELHALSKSASKIDNKTLNARLDIVEKQITAKLTEKGVLPKKAREIARKSRAAAELEISKASKLGAK